MRKNTRPNPFIHLFSLIFFVVLSAAGNTLFAHHHNEDSLRAKVERLSFEESHSTRLDLFNRLVNANKVEEADTLIHSSIRQAIETGDRTSEAQYTIMSAILQRSYHNYDSGYSILFDCMEWIQDLEHKDSMLQQIYNIFGIFLYDRGETMDALLYFKKALSIGEKLNSNSGQLSHAYNNMAVVSLNIDDYRKGLYYCNMAEAVSKGRVPELSVKLEHNRALLYSELEMYDSALYHHKKTFELLGEQRSPSVALYGMSDYMMSCIKMGMEFEADSILHQLKNVLRRERGLEYEKCYALACFSRFYRQKQHADSAKLYAISSFNIATAMGFRQKQREAATMLQKLYLKDGNRDSAIHYLELYQSITDSMESERDLRKLVELERRLNLWEQDRLMSENKIELGKESSQKRLFQSISGALLIIVVLSILLFVRKRKENRLLFEKAQLLSSQGERLRVIDHSQDKLSINEGAEERQNDEPKEVTLSPEQLKKISEGIEQKLIQRKLFLNQDCNAAMISGEIGTNRTYLSHFCKQEYGSTVKEFINDLRIQFVLEELNTSETKRKWTIEQLALEHGFGNKRTFERAFKARTGITPAFYIRELDA